MKALALDANTRLQLESLLGAQRGNARDMFILGGIIAKVQLTEEEKKRANYRAIAQGGQEFMVWNRAACELMEAKIVDLEDEQAARLSQVIESWGGFAPADIEQWVGGLQNALRQSQNVTTAPSSRRSKGA